MPQHKSFCVGRGERQLLKHGKASQTVCCLHGVQHKQGHDTSATSWPPRHRHHRELSALRQEHAALESDFMMQSFFFFMVTNVARDRKFMPLWTLRFLLHLKRSDTGWAISKEMWTLAVSEPTENSYLDTLGSNGEQKAMQGPWNWMITSNTANGYKTRTWKLKETNTQTNKPWAETAMNFYLARRHFQKAGQLLGPRSWKSLLAFTTFCSQESSVHVVFFWTSLLLLVTAEGEKASIINCHAIIQISSNQFPHCLETHNPQACEEESI